MVQRIALRSSLFCLALIASPALGSGGTLAGERPLQVVVSKEQQSLIVYDGDTVVATSHVSTGKKGHTTPSGIFSILQKARHHRSNIYSDAPMPFMQRLTWSGIALHASGHVPSYPASHGCVRLPNAFAKSLYGMTSTGMHVLISDRQVTPLPVADDFLFQPRPVSPPLLSDAALRPTVSQLPAKTTPVEVAMQEPEKPKPVVMPEGSPIRMLITWRGQREMVADVQRILGELGFVAGIADGVAGTQTLDAIRAFQESEKLTVDGKITPDLLALLYKKTNRGPPGNGQILVRRDFKPVFEAPLTIADPQKALGTHFLQFHAPETDEAKTGHGTWFVTTLDNVLPKAMKNRLGITEDADPLAAMAPTLDRLGIDEETRKRIEEMLVDGSSLTISDNGISLETGEGTDFVTITHTPAKG